jgi:tetratricopeptide (TPR) repeat protein
VSFWGDRIAKVLILILILPRVLACDSFEEGNQYYFNQAYAEAIKVYEKCLPNPGFALFFNLGNSYYKLGKYGNARLYYERASRLNSGDKNLIYNRSLLEDKLIDEEVSEFIGASKLSRDQVFLRVLSLFCLTAFLYLLRAKLGLVWSQMALVVCLLMGFYGMDSLKGQEPLAVVLRSEISVYSSQDLSSSVLTRIHEGKMLEVLRESEGWILVKVKAGIRGWVLAQSVGQV